MNTGCHRLRSPQQALRALQLDPGMGEAHAILGLIAGSLYQFDEAEQALRKAIAIDPRNAMAHHWLSTMMSQRGRFAEARTENERAHLADPGAPIVTMSAAYLRFAEGDFDGAAARYRRVIEASPDFGPVLCYIAELHAVQRRYAEAEAEFSRCTIPGYAERGRGVMYALAGRCAEASALATDLESRRDWPFPSAQASIWLALGDKERAYRLFDRACAEKDGLFWEMKIDPLFETFRADARFHDVLKCFSLE